MRPKFKNYTKPRPVWMIAVGDTMLYLGNSTAAVGIFTSAFTMALISLGIGTLGYFFTKLYGRIEAELIRQETTEVTDSTTKTTTKTITATPTPEAPEITPNPQNTTP